MDKNENYSHSKCSNPVSLLEDLALIAHCKSFKEKHRGRLTKMLLAGKDGWGPVIYKGRHPMWQSDPTPQALCQSLVPQVTGEEGKLMDARFTID